MEDTLIRGLVAGLMLGIVGFIANLIWKAIRSVNTNAEGSRRLKLVCWWAFGIGYTVLAFSDVALMATMIPLAVIAGTIYWIRTGMRK
jgi:hypothetical protein